MKGDNSLKTYQLKSVKMTLMMIFNAWIPSLVEVSMLAEKGKSVGTKYYSVVNDISAGYPRVDMISGHHLDDVAEVFPQGAFLPSPLQLGL